MLFFIPDSFLLLSVSPRLQRASTPKPPLKRNQSQRPRPDLRLCIHFKYPFPYCPRLFLLMLKGPLAGQSLTGSRCWRYTGQGRGDWRNSTYLFGRRRNYSPGMRTAIQVAAQKGSSGECRQISQDARRYCFSVTVQISVERVKIQSPVHSRFHWFCKNGLRVGLPHLSSETERPWSLASSNLWSRKLFKFDTIHRLPEKKSKRFMITLLLWKRFLLPEN